MHHLTYSHGGHSEQMLAFGGDAASRRILFIPPFFDEMNRLRHTWVEAMRALQNSDIASALPDYPGCNESRAPLEEQSLSSWRGAMADAAKAFRATHIFSVRGGCLIDDFDPTLPVMRLAPVKGKSLLNILLRTRMAGDKEAGIQTSAEDLLAQLSDGPVELAGHAIGAAMWRELEAAQASALHQIKEVKPKDLQGSALWLRAEPQHSAQMAAGIASAIAEWSQQP